MEDSITITWHIDDVKEVRPDLNDEQCMEVLREAKHDHDASIGINWDVLRAHADILFPAVEAVTMTEEQFDAEFPLIKNHLDQNASLDGCMFETYGEELAFVQKQDPLTVWTYQDDDNGNPCFTSGYHVVNRIGYIISKKPFKEGQSIFVRLG